MRLRRPLAALAMLAATLVTGAAQAVVVPLSDAELDTLRGGIQTPLGLDIGFGATVRTFVNGQLALETRLTWTDAGPVTSETRADLSSITGGPVFVGRLGEAVASTPGGATTILHDLADGRIASVIINTADNRTIRQETSITLTLPQLADLQSRIAGAQLSNAIQSAVSAAQLQGLR